MKLISIQEAYTRKFERQKRVPSLQFHASGHCAHTGPISPGCRSCFEPDPFRRNILCGARCNLNCDYCSQSHDREPGSDYHLKSKALIFKNASTTGFAPKTVSFSGGGEPLLYLDRIEEYMALFREVEDKMESRPWYYLYTNGILAEENVLARLGTLGFDEIRFHVGASGFSGKVLKNMERAVKHFRAVSVETPAWPPHRDKLFKTLPILQDIGIKHLNLGEIEINENNREKIAAALPGAEIYACHEMHLDDGGLTYDIMEEVVAKGYSYSVLDCNCFVKSMQRGPAKQVAHDDVKGLCAFYPSGHGNGVKSIRNRDNVNDFNNKTRSKPADPHQTQFPILSLETVFKPSKKVRLRFVEGETILVHEEGLMNPANSGVFKLNETGCAIWNAIDGQRDIEDILNAMVLRFDADKEMIYKGIEQFIRELVKRHIVIEVGKSRACLTL